MFKRKSIDEKMHTKICTDEKMHGQKMHRRKKSFTNKCSDEKMQNAQTKKNAMTKSQTKNSDKKSLKIVRSRNLGITDQLG